MGFSSVGMGFAFPAHDPHLHTLFVAPIGRLPYALLYPIADVLSQCLWWSGYRKKVVQSNLKRAFPEKTEKELRRTARQFYTHLAEVLVESLRHFHARRRPSC